MNKKIFSMVCAVALLSCGAALAEEQENLLVRNDAVVVCRSKQCKDARRMMTQEFLYNQLGSLLKNNINRRVSFCEADVNTHVCLNDAIAFEAVVGATPSTVYMPSALLVDAKAMSDEKTQKFVLDYDLKVGETYPSCQASLNQLRVLSADEISIETPGFECRFTENGITVVNASYEVDYIDFDYGIIGAHYTIGVGQVSKGGQSGYALWSFVNSANANNEVMNDCGCVCNDAQNPPCQCDAPKAVEQEVKEEKLPTEQKNENPASDVQQVAVEKTTEVVPQTEEALSEPSPVIIEQTVESKPPVVVQMPALEEATFITETQILKPGVPVVMDVEEDVRPGQVKAVSNWDK